MNTIARTILASLAIGLAAPAVQANEQKVVFGLAGPFAYQQAHTDVAKALGYFKEEGLDVQFRVVVGGSNAVAQTVSQQVLLSNPGIESVIIGKQPGKDALPLKFFYNATPTVIWEIVVPADSAIRNISDLKGKRIGIFGPSASNVPLVKGILHDAGVDPQSQVTLRSIGLGAGALNALKSGAVDAVALFDTEHAAFEASGFKIRKLAEGPVTKNINSIGLLTREDNLADPARRALLVKFGRAYAKATLFCEHNVTACIKLFWQEHPDLKPTGIDEAKALADGVHVLGARIEKMKLRDFQNGEYGRYAAAGWQDYVDFLLAKKELEKPVDVNTLYTNDLIAEINRFDRDAVIRQAKQYSK